MSAVPQDGAQLNGTDAGYVSILANYHPRKERRFPPGSEWGLCSDGWFVVTQPSGWCSIGG